MLNNLVEQKIVQEFSLSKGLLTKVSDLELITGLARFSDSDEDLARKLLEIVLSETSITSEKCLARCLMAISHMPPAYDLIKSLGGKKSLLFGYLRYPDLDMKEAAARIIINTCEVSKTEAVHILQALDACGIAKPEVIYLVSQICALS